MKTPFFAVAVLLSLFVGRPVYCQAVTSTFHVHGQETIDGSKNPELVPDAIAYHLVLVHYANVLEQRQDEAAMILSPIGLSRSDQKAFVAILHQFKTDHESAISSLSHGADYRSARDQHAMSAKSDIQAKLSLEGAQKVELFVQREKAHMQVPKQ